MTNKKIFSICFISVLMISCNISCKRYIREYYKAQEEKAIYLIYK
ncbi:hypothetical protein QIA45_05215 (plasmid) [Borreliella andersonii]|uniref:Uncharacterized protein n=1 Tax=Borrelia andersonii TaxID=42109 RepID=A0ACD5G6T3_BORAD